MESCQSFACQPDLWLSNWVFSVRPCSRGGWVGWWVSSKGKNWSRSRGGLIISYTRDRVVLNLVCNSRNCWHVLQMAPDPRLTQKYVISYSRSWSRKRWDLGRRESESKNLWQKTATKQGERQRSEEDFEGVPHVVGENQKPKIISGEPENGSS